MLHRLKRFARVIAFEFQITLARSCNLTATKATVLIVEDDPSNLEVIVRLLKKHDFAPEVANSAGEALLKLEGEQLPAAVILDLRLPDASGSVVLRNIRRHQLPIRVAVVTGVSDPSVFTDLMK